MNVFFYSTNKFEKHVFETQNDNKHRLKYFDLQLNQETAYMAKGADAVCIFVNDDASAPTLEKLCEVGIKFIVLRSAGYNNCLLYTSDAADERSSVDRGGRRI